MPRHREDEAIIHSLTPLQPTTIDRSDVPYVENAFGAKEIVHLDRISWAYLDWLAARGCDVDAWIRACDMQRHDNGQEFTDALFNWVYLAYKDREELGLDRPEWCPPFQG